MIRRLNQHVVFRYVFSGGVAASTTLVSLFILNTVLGVHYLVSSITAYCVGFCFSFVLQKYWTFKNHNTEKIHHQLFLYLMSSLLGLLLNTAIMYILVSGLHFYVFLSQIMAGLMVACVTFFISRRVFRQPEN
jgi:putative flippase GtrA